MRRLKMDRPILLDDFKDLAGKMMMMMMRRRRRQDPATRSRSRTREVNKRSPSPRSPKQQQPILQALASWGSSLACSSWGQEPRGCRQAEDH
jgi:hypothetical protein